MKKEFAYKNISSLSIHSSGCATIDVLPSDEGGVRVTCAYESERTSIQESFEDGECCIRVKDPDSQKQGPAVERLLNSLFKMKISDLLLGLPKLHRALSSIKGSSPAVHISVYLPREFSSLKLKGNYGEFRIGEVSVDRLQVTGNCIRCTTDEKSKLPDSYFRANQLRLKMMLNSSVRTSLVDGNVVKVKVIRCPDYEGRIRVKGCIEKGAGYLDGDKSLGDVTIKGNVVTAAVKMKSEKENQGTELAGEQV